MGRYLIALMVSCLAVITAACSLRPELGEPRETHIRAADGMEMGFVPGGSFWMGSTEEEVQEALALCLTFWNNCRLVQFADEGPRHRVKLDSFWMDRAEVSNQQYRLCVAAGACTDPRCWTGLQFDAPEQPVVCLTWEQADSYCSWVGGRLASEAEWEYAARGQAGTFYPWGDEFDGTRLNYCDRTCGRPRSDPRYDDGHYYSAPVRSYPEGASWCGVLDLSGNVLEWVGDNYGPYDPAQKGNPVGLGQGATRVIRGGSWFLSPAESRSAWRQGLPQEDWYDDLGFRCVVPGEEQ